MARGKGYQGIVGINKATTWGTAVAAGALDGLFVQNLDVGDAGTEAIEDDSVSGNVTQEASDAGNHVANPKIESALWYEGLEPMIAFVHGTAGVPGTVDTTARQHKIMINNSLEGIFATLAYEFLKDTKVGEVQTAKWNKLTVSGRAGNEPIKCVFEGLGFDWTDSSSTNTTTTIDTVTIPANRLRAVWSHVSLQMNAQGGGALGGGDAIFIAGFEFSIERGMDARYSTQHGNKPDEPIDSGWTKVMLSLDFPAVQDGTGGNQGLMADQLNFVQKKAKLFLTSTTLAGAATQMFQHVLWFPKLTPMPSPKGSIPGPEAPTWRQTWQAHHVGTIPTGFTAGYVGAVTFEIFSQRAADALA